MFTCKRKRSVLNMFKLVGLVSEKSQFLESHEKMNALLIGYLQCGMYCRFYVAHNEI